MKLSVILGLIIALLFYSLTSTAGQQNAKGEGAGYLFQAGTYGYYTYRIPAIICTVKGTLLAFAERRKNSSSDTGDIDLVMKRSEDNGKHGAN